MFARPPLLASLCGLVLIAMSAMTPPVGLIWNRTGSLPVGLYAVFDKDTLMREDLVAFQPAKSQQDWLEARGYIGHGWPLIKQVAALEGDTVCRLGQDVSVNGRVIARALERDMKGRQLPRWQGCEALAPGEVFLMAPHPHSIDGRYFGVQKASAIRGCLTPVWIRTEPENSATSKDRRMSSDAAQGHG